MSAFTASSLARSLIAGATLLLPFAANAGDDLLQQQRNLLAGTISSAALPVAHNDGGFRHGSPDAQELARGIILGTNTPHRAQAQAQANSTTGSHSAHSHGDAQALARNVLLSVTPVRGTGS
jgi:hypothetical protein